MTASMPNLRVVTSGSRAQADLESADTLPEVCVRAELRRVLASPYFDASERNRRFLQYVVEETLAGRSRRIKAYCIATDVFGRGEDFNGQSDPVVRMEARRLRQSLERFYLVEGEATSVRIALPKGGYVPAFLPTHQLQARTQTLCESLPEPAPVPRISMLISSFELEDAGTGSGRFSDGLVRQIVVGLSQIRGLSVFVTGPLLGLNSHSIVEFPQASNVDFILSGNVIAFPDAWHVKAILVDARSGNVVWGEAFERSFTVDFRHGVRDQIADNVVRNLVQCVPIADQRSWEHGHEFFADIGSTNDDRHGGVTGDGRHRWRKKC